MARRREESIGGRRGAGPALSGLVAAILAAGAAPARGPAPGPDPIEALLQGAPEAARFSRHLLHLTEEPHATGTPRDLELADYVRDRFREYGLDEVGFHDTPALLSYGRSASVEIVAPVPLRLRLGEAPHAADKDSFLYRSPGVVPFHAYAADGDVEAEVVYANSGSPEDFAELRRRGIDVAGRIVLMRYSEPYSYRGHKVFLAESNGAAAAMLYSDPIDDGFARGDTYPDGPYGPPSHVQWGSIIYDWFGPGEPFTFHWTRAPGGAWTEGPVRDRQLPRIPSLPLSWEDAAPILKQLGGRAVPRAWQGGLPFTYHTGPGPARVRLRVDNDERIGTIRNVVGVLRGAAEPAAWVVLGNHRDAWIYGAVDPSSGTAVLLEVARALGAAARAGHRPRRSIVLANWGAEEDLLGGSTSWVKDHRDRLRENGVVYINVDSGASGPHFEGGATPALAAALRAATAAIADPRGGTIHDAWAARSRTGVAEVDTIVGATDYTAFQEHVGMSCIDMSFSGPYGVYHSQYDDYHWLSRIGDPGFLYNLALARLWGVLAWRLADADLLPMRFSDYAAAMPGAIERIERKGAPRPLRLDRAREAAARWERAARAFEALPAAAAGPALARVNRLLLAVERAMTEPEGLRGRPFFKHLIYAPAPTYREEVLPRLHEAIEAGDWEALPRLEAQIVAAFDAAAALLDEARAALAGEAARPPS